jgi:CheY-like chemotaxis protein
MDSPTRPAKAAHPLRILYAEDFAELRNFMRTLLTKDGHLVETVPDGAAALAWLRTAGDAVDLLITDHHMPGMNGLDLVRALRAGDFPGRIVVFSSELSPSVHDEYQRLGVDLILPKPIFPVTLRRVLNELFTPGPNRPALSAAGVLVLS